MSLLEVLNEQVHELVPHAPAPRRVEQAVFTIVCNDDDGDGSVYFLLDPSGKPIAEHAWPSPLEELAGDLGGQVVRAPSMMGGEGNLPYQACAPECYVREYEIVPGEDRAEAFLEEWLRDGPLPAREIEKRCREQKIAPDRLREAVKRLGIEKHRSGKRGFVTPGGGFKSRVGTFFAWSLPGQYDATLAAARAAEVGIGRDADRLAVVAEFGVWDEDAVPGVPQDDEMLPEEREMIRRARDEHARQHVRVRTQLDLEVERRVNGNGHVNGNGRSPVVGQVYDERPEGALVGESIAVGANRSHERLHDVIEVIVDEPVPRPESMKEDPVAEKPVCKIDGCTNEATGKASFSGLCDEHKSAEASRRNRKGHKVRKAAPPTPAKRQKKDDDQHPVDKLKDAYRAKGVDVGDGAGKRVPPSEQIVVDDDTRELLGAGRSTSTPALVAIEDKDAVITFLARRLQSSDRGISSDALIVAAVFGDETSESPRDQDDLGRCYRALAAAPPELQKKMVRQLADWTEKLA